MRVQSNDSQPSDVWGERWRHCELSWPNLEGAFCSLFDIVKEWEILNLQKVLWE
jgi:hypothetical protein